MSDLKITMLNRLNPMSDYNRGIGKFANPTNTAKDVTIDKTAAVANSAVKSELKEAKSIKQKVQKEITPEEQAKLDLNKKIADDNKATEACKIAINAKVKTVVQGRICGTTSSAFKSEQNDTKIKELLAVVITNIAVRNAKKDVTPKSEEEKLIKALLEITSDQLISETQDQISTYTNSFYFPGSSFEKTGKLGASVSNKLKELAPKLLKSVQGDNIGYRSVIGSYIDAARDGARKTAEAKKAAEDKNAELAKKFNEVKEAGIKKLKTSIASESVPAPENLEKEIDSLVKELAKFPLGTDQDSTKKSIRSELLNYMKTLNSTSIDLDSNKKVAELKKIIEEYKKAKNEEKSAIAAEDPDDSSEKPETTRLREIAEETRKRFVTAVENAIRDDKLMVKDGEKETAFVPDFKKSNDTIKTLDTLMAEKTKIKIAEQEKARTALKTSLEEKTPEVVTNDSATPAVVVNDSATPAVVVNDPTAVVNDSATTQVKAKKGINAADFFKNLVPTTTEGKLKLVGGAAVLVGGYYFGMPVIKAVINFAGTFFANAPKA